MSESAEIGSNKYSATGGMGLIEVIAIGIGAWWVEASSLCWASPSRSREAGPTSASSWGELEAA